MTGRAYFFHLCGRDCQESCVLDDVRHAGWLARIPLPTERDGVILSTPRALRSNTGASRVLRPFGAARPTSTGTASISPPMTEPRTTAGRELLAFIDSNAPTDAADPSEDWVAEWWAWRNEIEWRILTIESEATSGEQNFGHGIAADSHQPCPCARPRHA